MWYNVLFDIVLFVAVGVSAVVLQLKYAFIVAGVATIGVAVRLLWLRDLIADMQESQPVKRSNSRKKKSGVNKKMLISILAMELVAAIALYILYQNGIEHSLWLDFVCAAFAAILGIFLG